MDTNQQNTWSNLEKMETDHGEDNHMIQLHDHQIKMGSGIWPSYHPLHQIPCPSSLSLPSSSSGFLNDIIRGNHFEDEETEEEELGDMKEMMYKIAAMQPVDIDPASIRKPKRRNVRISDDPQSVAARHRRERISEKIRILQRLVPGGTKMDTASMLDEAIRYVKFLKRQIRLLQSTPQHSQQPPQCNIGNNGQHGSSANPSTLLLAHGGDCPFAPNILQGSTTSTSLSMDMTGFNSGGHDHAGDGSFTFNHRDVISE